MKRAPYSNLPETLSTVLYVLAGVLLALGINMGLAVILNTDMPVVAVESDSMKPVFVRGDLLVLQGVLPGELEIGDVIVFFPPNSPSAIVHRIITKNPDGTFQTKGDANNGQLPFEHSIHPDAIHGKSIATIPWLGWVKIGVTEYILPNALFVVVIIVALYGGYSGYKKVFK